MHVLCDVNEGFFMITAGNETSFQSKLRYFANVKFAKFKFHLLQF